MRRVFDLKASQGLRGLDVFSDKQKCIGANFLVSFSSALTHLILAKDKHITIKVDAMLIF